MLNCKTAQTTAEKAITSAKADIMDTETRLAQVSCRVRKVVGHPPITNITGVYPEFMRKLTFSTLPFCVCLLLKLSKGCPVCTINAQLIFFLTNF